MFVSVPLFRWIIVSSKREKEMGGETQTEQKFPEGQYLLKNSICCWMCSCKSWSCCCWSTCSNARSLGTIHNRVQHKLIEQHIMWKSDSRRQRQHKSRSARLSKYRMRQHGVSLDHVNTNLLITNVSYSATHTFIEGIYRMEYNWRYREKLTRWYSNRHRPRCPEVKYRKVIWLPWGGTSCCRFARFRCTCRVWLEGMTDNREVTEGHAVNGRQCGLRSGEQCFGSKKAQPFYIGRCKSLRIGNGVWFYQEWKDVDAASPWKRRLSSCELFLHFDEMNSQTHVCSSVKLGNEVIPVVWLGLFTSV